MIQITDKYKCCGCSACYSICPKHAIKMEPDKEGFLYPVIDKGKCIDCKQCNYVCPIETKKNNESDFPLKSYAVRNKNAHILKNSASGGFFSAIADYIVDRNGYVFGAIYDEYFKVCHWGTDKHEDISKFRSSKYVQSDLKDIFVEIKRLLELEKLVCFSGTPCQVEGLKKFLRRDYMNLVTVDMICHGVPSPLLWEKYLEYMQHKKKSNIISVNFRNKDYGYRSGSLFLQFSNGKIHHGSTRNDVMMKCFFGEISSRLSCYRCAFKYAKHVSDFTVFDAWHAPQLIGIPDDDKGFTHLFINSDKGIELVEKLEDKIDIYEVDAEEAIKLDGPMVRHSAIPHKNRADFLFEVRSSGLEKAVKKYIPISKKDVFIVSTKGFLYKIGLLNIMKKIAKKFKI